MIAERLKRARKASGLSLRALADEVGVSQTTINKYEKADSVPSSAQLLKLSRVLEVRAEYFFRPVEIELKKVEYRKRASTSKKLLARIEADVLDQAERWTTLLSLYPQAPVRRFAVPDRVPARIGALSEVEAVADAVRGAWLLGLNPIPHMIELLEAQGVLVIVTAVDVAAKLDGLAASVDGIPVIVVSADWPGDRQRFTLAHELGHLVLGGRLGASVDEEKACDRFAGAFLLPQRSALEQLGEHRQRLEPTELLLLKREYGLSMMGCLMRAFQCGVVSESVKLSLLKLFSMRGWRTEEPGDPCAAETTFLYRRLVFRALAEDYLSESKAAELLGISTPALRAERKLGSVNAAVAHQ